MAAKSVTGSSARERLLAAGLAANHFYSDAFVASN